MVLVLGARSSRNMSTLHGCPFSVSPTLEVGMRLRAHSRKNTMLPRNAQIIGPTLHPGPELTNSTARTTVPEILEQSSSARLEAL